MQRLDALSIYPILLMLLTLATSVHADDVVLNPGTISGSVSLTGYNITSVTVRAMDTTKTYSASTTASASGGASSIDYTLTVEGANDYYVMAEVYVVTSDGSTLRTHIPPPSPVTVAIGANTPLNLSMTPAIISGTISTGSSANTISSYGVYGYLQTPQFDPTYSYATTTRSSLSAAGDTGVDYTLLVAPDTHYNWLRANVGVDGLYYNIYDYTVLNPSPAAGTTLDRDFPIDVTAATISGHALLNDVDVTLARVYGFGQSNGNTTNSYVTIPDIATGEYVLPVNAGNWRLYPYFYFNLPNTDPDLSGLLGYLQQPYTPAFTVNAGDELVENFDITPGLMPGKLNLWGANTNFYNGYVRAYGFPNGGQVYSQVDPDTGKFLFVASPGDWQADYYQYLYFDYPDDPDASLRSSVSQYYYNSPSYPSPYMQTAVAGQTNDPVELSYGTITVRRYFYVADDGMLSSPFIRATRSEAPYSTAIGYGSPYATTEGQAVVTLLLPGNYALEAFATVDGSVTEFGTVNISVEPGDVVVIGGTARPTIKVSNPTNGEDICGTSVTVEGTATDDVGIASITINGQVVDFQSTNNPDDPNEVSFSHELTLTLGQANDITVTVADTDQTDPISLSLTVNSERCGPEEIAVPFDVKPGSCPNPLNTKSKGVLPAAILGSADFDVTSVDIDSVNILGVTPVRSDYDDVATPYYPAYLGKVDKLDCTTEGADGFNDLTLKFDRQQIVQALESAGYPVADGQVIALPLSAKQLDALGGSPIVGEDVIVILDKGH